MIACHKRQGQPNAGIATARLVRTFLWGGFAAPQKCPCPELSGDRYTDGRDSAMLLLTYPALKTHPGAVTNALITAEASPAIIGWQSLVPRTIQPVDEGEAF